MSNILLLGQHAQGRILKASLIALRAAQELQKAWNKGSILGICLGPESRKGAEELLEYGLAQVFYSEHPSLEKYLAHPYSECLLNALAQGSCDTLVGAATSTGKDLFPRVAACMDAGQASDIIAVNADGSLKRPLFAGNVLADVQVMTEKRCVTVRATAFQPATKTQKSGSVSELTVTTSTGNTGEVVSYELSASSRPELSEAEIVVSGGRALQSAENFEKYMFPLADALGAAVGASRAAVDSGYAPNDWQVGQTGKVVAPNLYVAVGISGAIQHLAGMKDSKVIVAINKDPDAPIFEVADYGLVADLYQVLPQLTEEIKKARSG